ncbi:MAG: MoxR family ATPase [Lachnospiraceae bacterium]|nr:MoxR family ATPase [Lachnospiraceae bacterium]
MDIAKVKEISNNIKNNVSKIIVGKEDVIELFLTALWAGGHILIEDTPGTGKTMLAKSMAKSIDGDFKRVQFTPDLMPSDITGLNVYSQKSGEFSLVKGPVFTNILLADEINRATPRTQSSLLEAMEERQVTIDGETMSLTEPFMVFATENPVETTGTYPLPEAQLDRFLMKISMGSTTKNEELNIIDRFISASPLEELRAVATVEQVLLCRQAVQEVFVHKCIREYIVDIIMATRESSKINVGVSSRGTLGLLNSARAYAAIQGRTFVEPDDVKKVAPYVLGHRIIAFGISGDAGAKIIRDIVASVKVPVEDWER